MNSESALVKCNGELMRENDYDPSFMEPFSLSLSLSPFTI